MAALVRQGAASAASALANTEAVPQSPKTFGIPLHTCVMSPSHQVVSGLMYYYFCEYCTKLHQLSVLSQQPTFDLTVINIIDGSGRVTN